MEVSKTKRDFLSNKQHDRSHKMSLTDIRLGFTFFVLFLVGSIAFTGWILSPQEAGTLGNVNYAGDAFKQAFFILVLVATIATCPQGQLLKSARLVSPAMLMLFAWCWLSILWSIDPETTVRRLALTTIGTITTYISIQRLGPKKTWGFMVSIVAFVVIIDWVSVLISPNAVHSYSETDKSLVGMWRGIHSDKNAAGSFMALAGLLSFSSWLGSQNRLWLAFLAASLGFLYMTGSKTSLGLEIVSVLLSIAIYFAEASSSIRRCLIFLLFSVPPLLFLSLAHYYNDLINIIESPDALTGRTQIWPVLVEYASDNLVFGSGYGAFWNIGALSPISKYASGWVVTVFNGHNGYLDILIQLGAPGLALACVALVAHPISCAIQAKSLPLAKFAVIPPLIFILVLNLMETTLLDRVGFDWIVVLICSGVIYCQYKDTSGR